MLGDDALPYLTAQDRLSPPFLRGRARAWLQAQQQTAMLARFDAGRQFGRLCMLSPDGMVLVDRDSIREVMEATAKAEFILDLAAGHFSVGAATVEVRPEALHVRLLEYLLQIWPQNAPVDEVYEMVWGAAFDEDIDLFVVKTAVYRLRKLLEHICPVSGISLTGEKKGMPRLELHLPVHWQAWVRVAA